MTTWKTDQINQISAWEYYIPVRGACPSSSSRVAAGISRGWLRCGAIGEFQEDFRVHSWELGRLSREGRATSMLSTCHLIMVCGLEKLGEKFVLSTAGAAPWFMYKMTGSTGIALCRLVMTSPTAT